MILYYAPGACSQAPHILLNETGLSHSIVRVDHAAHKLEDGGDYYTVNPKGSVPALRLDNGEVLTENAVILQYLADRSGDEQLLARLGEIRRYRVLEWLNFIATELHKSFGPLFNRAAGEETKKLFRELIGKKLDYVSDKLGSGPWLMGDRFTIADPYLFVITGWTILHGLGFERWPRLVQFRERMAERPAVRRVLEREGLLQPEAAR